MKISAKARYAVRLLLDLSMNGDRGPVRTADLSAHTGISVRFIEQILQPLKKAGLVRSTRGAAGGYMLSADPAKISMARIVRIIEGSLCLTNCCETPADCPRSPDCRAHQAWARATRALEAELDSISIADLQEGLAPDSPQACACKSPAAHLRS